MNLAGLGATLMAAAVGLGALGAHGLRSRLDAHSLEIWERAVFYHFVHALGLLLLALFERLSQLSPAASTRISVLLLAGIALFSGSLYALALTGVRLLGAVTPLGGLAFLVAWLMLAWELFQRKKQEQSGR